MFLKDDSKLPFKKTCCYSLNILFPNTLEEFYFVSKK